VRFLTLIALIAITSSLVLTTIAMVPQYVYGTYPYLLSGPITGVTVEYGDVELKQLMPPMTLLAARVAELTEMTSQASNASTEGIDEENYAGALRTCRLSIVVTAEIEVKGAPRNGFVSVDGYVAVGDRRKGFHIVTPGLSAAYVSLANVSCTDELRVVITNVKASHDASLEGLGLSYTVYVSVESAVRGASIAYPLVAQDALVVAALALLGATYSRCRKYFS